MSSDRRIFWTKTVTAAGLTAGLLISANLWAGARSFPRVPVLGNALQLPLLLEAALFAVLLAASVAIIVSPRPRKFIFAAIASALLLAFFDQMRWQPWFFQYLFMLAALASFSWRGADSERREAALDACRIILVSMYFYGGMQKMNPVFTGDVFPWIIGPFTFIPHFFGYVVPFIEIGIGFGLLWKRSRTIALALAIGMSAFVLLALGPFGRDWNAVVWPWNIVMAALAVVLFWKSETVPAVVFRTPFLFQKAVFLFFMILPACSFVGFWDSYLSASLYSGNTDVARVYVDGSKADIAGWSFGELHVPPYPEKRVFKGIARALCTGADTVRLEVTEKKTFFGGGKTVTYDCRSL